MKLQSILAVTSLAGLAQCVTMAGYSPGAGVEAEFKTFLQASVLDTVKVAASETLTNVSRLYATAETPSATTTFSNFFTSNGRLIVLSNTATGAQQIIALKQRLLPPAGNKHWNHRPGSTTVSSENGAQKTYLVVGEIQTTFDGGNCSKAS